MSGPAAQTATTVTMLDNKPPSVQHSSRPPTYQSTQSASKRSTANVPPNIASFNPLPQQSRNVEGQYATGNFPSIEQMQHNDSNIPKENNNEIYSLRNTLQKSGRSNSMNNQIVSGSGTHWTSVVNQTEHHNSSQVAAAPRNDNQLQPIMSQYGGEITSRSGQHSPNKARYDALIDQRSRESPLRRSKEKQMVHSSVNNERSSLVDDSKLDANAYAMHNVST